MSFPLKFKEKLETTKKDIDIPDEVWIVYAICGCEKDSCGWEGWVLESVLNKKNTKKVQLKCLNDQICPHCGKDLFRTDTQIKMKYSKDQTGLLIPGKDYDTAPMEYE